MIPQKSNSLTTFKISVLVLGLLLISLPVQAEEQKDGIRKEYNSAGKLKTEWNYLNGKLEGISKDYDNNQQIKHEWRYHEGKLEGVSKRYY